MAKKTDNKPKPPAPKPGKSAAKKPVANASSRPAKKAKRAAA